MSRTRRRPNRRPRRTQAPPNTVESQLLRAVLFATFSPIGDEFFRLLVRCLASALGVRYAFVTTCVDPPDPGRVRTLGIWLGHDLGQNFEYAVSGTPCQGVLSEKHCVFFPDLLQTLFPEDRQLVELDARSYLGVPLLSRGNELLGHLAVLDDRPMSDEGTRTAILKAVASRAAAELERWQAERAGQRRIAELLEASSRTLEGLIPICAWCKSVRDETGTWLEPEEYVRRRTRADFTHGICPECARELRPGRVKLQ